MTSVPRSIEEQLKARIRTIKRIIEERKDPFTVDISSLLDDLRFFLEKYGEKILHLDAEAIENIVMLLVEQEEWLKMESQLLGLSSLAALMTLRKAPLKKIASIFLAAWIPQVYRDHLTLREIKRGLKYIEAFRRLPKKPKVGEEDTLGLVNEKFLKYLGIIGEKDFKKKLSEYALKIASQLEKNSRIEYWDAIIDENDYRKTVENALLLSHLISRGNLAIEIDPLKEKIFIVKEGKNGSKRSNRFSLAVSINYLEWVKRVGKEG